MFTMFGPMALVVFKGGIYIGYLNEFNGFNFHRITLCKYYNEPDGFKKEGIGATLEYWHRNDGRRIYALGVIVIVPYKDLIIKYSNEYRKKTI